MRGQISEHIFLPNEGYCLRIEIFQYRTRRPRAVLKFLVHCLMNVATVKYEPKAPSFRVFDPRCVTRVNSQDSLSNFVQSQWK